MIPKNELIERKKVSNFLENLLNFCGYEFRHDHFKEIIYCEKEYKIVNLYVFGSFAKNKQRIDSDIGFLVKFSLDLTYEEKCENIEKLANHYSTIFNRNIDFTEVESYLTDHFIKVMTNVKKIF